MENKSNDYSHIKGWGIDANPENDPTYPIKERIDDLPKGYNWKRPTQQTVNTEILHSNERPNVSAVFGTTCPPSGLSGTIRRFAFKYSENSYLHWLPLLLADRVNVLEGIADDLKRGHFTNILSEKGIKAQWKYDRKNLLIKVAAITLVTTIATGLVYRKKKKLKRKN